MKPIQFFSFLFFLQISLIAQYQIQTYVFGNGGSIVSNSDFQIFSTTGETFIGKAEEKTYTIFSGFWQPVMLLTPVKDNKDIISDKYILMQNYPNPFNPSTTIRYSIPKESFVTIKVYDIIGREIATLVNERKAAGNHSVKFNASNFSSGAYIYRIQSGGFTDTKKLILLK